MASPATTQAFLLGLVFFLVFAAYDTIQVYAKSTYPDDVGPTLLMTIYIAFAAIGPFSPSLVHILGSRLAISSGIICYSTLVAAGLVYFETGYSTSLIIAAGVLLILITLITIIILRPS